MLFAKSSKSEKGLGLVEFVAVLAFAVGIILAFVIFILPLITTVTDQALAGLSNLP